MIARWVFLSLAILGIAGCLALENRLVYLPRKDLDNSPPPPPLADLELHTADGVKIHARWCPRPGTSGALLYCHGNAGNVAAWGRRVQALWDGLDQSVLIVDYPGYGRSEGKPSEAGCYAAAEAAYRWLSEKQGVAPERIIICGESLGGGIATELASKHPHRALVLIRTFTSLPDVGEHLSSLPAQSMMFNRYDNIKRLPECSRPVFIASADRDHIVPFAHGERLKKACAGPSELFRLEGLGHNDPLPPAFFAHVRQFLEKEAP